MEKIGKITREADEQAIEYADEQLRLYRPDIASMEIARSRKMGINVFNGADIENTFAVGYESGAYDVLNEFQKILDDACDRTDKGEKIMWRDVVLSFKKKIKTLKISLQII